MLNCACAPLTVTQSNEECSHSVQDLVAGPSPTLS